MQMVTKKRLQKKGGPLCKGIGFFFLISSAFIARQLLIGMKKGIDKILSLYISHYNLEKIFYF